MKKVYLLLIIIFLFIIASFLGWQFINQKTQLQNNNLLIKTSQKPKKNTLKAGKCEFEIEFAKTNAEKQQGLSGREKLEKQKGMLFVYDQAAVWHFWMKDMNFPLDFVWIKDNIAADISENIPVLDNQGQISRISPKIPVDKILEINADMVKECNIEINSEVIIII